jgi:hypothetical protein
VQTAVQSESAACGITTYVLADRGVSSIAGPVVTDGGDVIVAILDHAAADRLRLVTRRVDAAGTLHPAQTLAEGESISRPQVARTADARILLDMSTPYGHRLVALRSDGTIDPTVPATEMPAMAWELTAGPRGVLAWFTFPNSVVRWGPNGVRDEWPLPVAPWLRDGGEQALAAGPARDAMIRLDGPRETARWILDVFPARGDGPPRERTLMEAPRNDPPFVAIAAGPNGFALAYDHFHGHDIAFELLDPAGASLGPPRTIARATRDAYANVPRITATREGWAVSYRFDGLSIRLARLTPAGDPIGETVAIALGDHAGPNRDSRMAPLPDGIVIAWQLVPNPMHLIEGEVYGVRLALIRCGDSGT